MRSVYYYLLLFTLLHAQDPWGGVSVATPDNLNAITANPAGLGISRGYQSGIYSPFDSVFTIYKSKRIKGFGYDLKYKFIDGKFPDTFNPADGNIGFGAALFSNAYAGIKWNKHHFIDFGFLYRPINQVSLGLTSRFSDELDKYHESTLGIALRPFFKHHLTLGADINILDNDSTIIYPHITIEPIDGMRISARSNEDFDNYQINLAFNFGKVNIFYPSSYNSDSDYSGGIGFYTDTEQQKSIFKKKEKDTNNYVRMKLSGLFIEEKPYEPPFNLDFNFSPFGGKPDKGIQLRTWIEEIDKLSENDNCHGLIIDIGQVRAGFAKRGEIYSALQRFKNQGKTIFVYASQGISNADYHLISMADEIYINEYTGINLTGLKMEINFFRGLLDTLLIVPEVFRVNFDGKSYKTAADQFLNKKMSDEMRENYGNILNDWFDIFVQDIAAGRKWEIEYTKKIIDEGPYFRPQDAISAGLADSILYPDQFDDYLHSLNDEKVTITKFHDIDRSNFYVNEWAPAKKEKIAVIYAVGGIISGKSNPGPAGSSLMGDESIVKAIKTAREDDEIKAIVLRIDSGGGSALASDQMWREVLKTTEEDTSNIKPFIASMSDVAASGGYYIACQADTIVAHPATITGSIGVIGLRLNISKLLNKFGITSDLIKKGEYSDFGSGNRLIKDKEREKIQASINDVYTKFKNRVIDGRDDISQNANLDDVALGRVFSGKRAKDGISIPLVDVTGDFNVAIELAKSAAGLLEDDQIEIVEFPLHKNTFSALFDKSESKTQNLDRIMSMLPEELSNQLEILELLPVILDDDLQMIIPYYITIQ